jgi:tetratricopeptide (TPR) repeat protein
MLLSRLTNNLGDVRRTADSLMKLGGDDRRRSGLPAAIGLAVLEGRMRTAWTLESELPSTRVLGTPDHINQVLIDIKVMGLTPALSARLDSVIGKIPFHQLPMIDRPYLQAAMAYAHAGNPDKARAMFNRYRAEMTDASIARIQVSDVHQALAEIALASGKPQEALEEFRRGDIGADGAPANECNSCLPFNLGRAYDAAGKPDSAAMMFEQYLATPTWWKGEAETDGVRLPAIRERLGQLYEGLGNVPKAIENYKAFIELWKNADPELQPRVADARRRLARLTQPESPRH